MTPEQLKALMDWVRHAANYEADLVVNPGSDFNSGSDERIARNTLYKAFGFVGTSPYIDPGEPKYCDESN